MNHAALKTYLQTNYASDFAAGNDGAMYAAMTVTDGTKTGKVEGWQLKIWAAATGMRAVIEDLATSAGNPLRASALSFRDLLQTEETGLDLAIAENMALVNAWEAATVLSAEAKAALLAFAAKPASVAELNGFAGLTFDDIVTARTL